MKPQPHPGAKNLSRRLCAWFNASARKLPWRGKGRTPYRVWVSEIMLQQTQVSAVVPYFERWMERFPDLPSLARADEQTVLKLWEGLGYYSRARNLLKAARIMMEKHAGKIPSGRDTLEALPGVGRYTAGAVLSLAYGVRSAVVDGNVKRVLARVFCLENPVPARLWEIAESLMPEKNPGGHNEALMELGARICTPARPACGRCPLAALCLARRRGRQESLPAKKPKAETKAVEACLAVIEKNGKVLVQQRRNEGLWANLWELPGGKMEPGETPAKALERELGEELGVEAKAGKCLMTIRHAYTRYRVRLYVLEAKIVSGRPAPKAARRLLWAGPEELGKLPFPAANARIIEFLLKRPRE